MTFTFALEFFLRNTFPVSVVNTSPSVMQLLPPHPVPSSTAVPNQSIMGGILQGARCLAYPTAPLLAATPRESPCRLPSYTE